LYYHGYIDILAYGVVMKLNKIFICLICLLLNFSVVKAEEIGHLYVIKSVPKENLVNIIDNYLSQINYNAVKKTDCYILPSASMANPNGTGELVLQQDGDNCYLYYLNSQADNLDDLVLKEIKKGHYKVTKITDPETENAFFKRAAVLKNEFRDSLKQAPNTYDFSERAQESFNEARGYAPVAVMQAPPQPMKVKAPRQNLNCPTTIQPLKSNAFSLQDATPKPIATSKSPLKGAVVRVAQGTSINAVLESAVSSASLAQSDKITAVLNDDFKYNDSLIFPSGTILYGSAANATTASYGYGNGSLDLVFNQALTPDGRKIDITVDKISYAKESKRAANITKNVLIGTGVGLLGGLLSAASTGNYQQALLVGAGIGAASGGIYAATQKGEEIEIPEGTVLRLILSQPINISPYN